jgi:threonine synthase
MRSFVAHLESAIDGTRLPAGELNTIQSRRPLWVRYDLAQISQSVSRNDIARRPPSLWRYRELLPLPLDVEPVTLGEGMTPLVPCPRIGASTRPAAIARQR